MTRKKYIKALMALDVPRNLANSMAWYARATGTPYAEDYKARRPWLQLEQNMRRVKQAILGLGVAITSAAAKITEALAVSSIFKLDPADYELDPAREWPKENPHLDGLRADVVLVDEWDSLPSDKLHDQAVQACAGGGGHD